MKKLILLFTVAVVALAMGCNHYHVITEDHYVVDYVYFNKTSSEITVHSFFLRALNEGSADSLFVIPVGGSHTVTDYMWTNNAPLSWLSAALVDEDYTIISNEDKTVTQTRGGQKEDYLNSLYYADNYTIVSSVRMEDKYNTVRLIALYIFTDEFFENGEPIEQ